MQKRGSSEVQPALWFTAVIPDTEYRCDVTCGALPPPSARISLVVGMTKKKLDGIVSESEIELDSFQKKKLDPDQILTGINGAICVWM